MTSREQLAAENEMSIEYVNWFLDNKKDGCGNVWFMMMVAMWEGWKERDKTLEESSREFRAADATIHNLELKLTDMAVQLANAESKRRELAAENAALKELIEQHANSVAVCPNCSHEEPSETDDIVALYRSMETPATDAFLAEVRAQGVEAFVMDFTEPAVMNNGTFYNEDLFEASKEFAAQLRQGAAL